MKGVFNKELFYGFYHTSALQHATGFFIIDPFSIPLMDIIIWVIIVEKYKK